MASRHSICHSLESIITGIRSECGCLIKFDENSYRARVGGFFLCNIYIPLHFLCILLRILRILVLRRQKPCSPNLSNTAVLRTCACTRTNRMQNTSVKLFPLSGIGDIPSHTHLHAYRHAHIDIDRERERPTEIQEQRVQCV